MSDSELFQLYESQQRLTKMPTDKLFVEEHLKTWVIKKMFAEAMILSEEERTKSISMLGMGTYHGKRMSASKGVGDTLPMLLNKYGRETTRLSLLLVSNPSNSFEWDENVPHSTTKVFHRYQNILEDISKLPEGDDTRLGLEICESKQRLEKHFESGEYRKACLEGIVEFPKKISKLGLEVKGHILKHKEYIESLFGIGGKNGL